MAKTKRVEVTPDRDGKVIVVCGDEVLELVIKSATESAVTKSSAESASAPIGIGKIRIDQPFAYMVKNKQWLSDVDEIVSSAVTEHRNPKTRKVRSIVVKSPSLDLHALNRLSGKLERHLPDAGLRVDLRKGSRRRG